MANTKEIQDRIKSINDTLKITNAMYMISSSKLKKSKKMLSDTEPYFFTLQSEMSRILRHIPDISSIYFKTNEDKDAADKKVGYIVITADKGLAGSYNHNVLKIAQEQLEKNPNHSLFVLGELGRVIGGAAGYFIFRYVIKGKYNEMIEAANKEAEVVKEKKLLEVKEKFLNKKAELEKEVQQRNSRIQQNENKLKQREISLNQRQEDLGRRKMEIDQYQQRVDNEKKLLSVKQQELDKMQKQEQAKLEELSGLSAEEAKQRLIESLKDQAKLDAASYVRQLCLPPTPMPEASQSA